jgi:hypothetical protein
MNTKNNTFNLYFTNINSGLRGEFATLDEALAYAKRACFESSIFVDGNLVAAWSPIGGTQHYRR